MLEIDFFNNNTLYKKVKTLKKLSVNGGEPGAAESLVDVDEQRLKKVHRWPRRIVAGDATLRRSVHAALQQQPRHGALLIDPH